VAIPAKFAESQKCLYFQIVTNQILPMKKYFLGVLIGVTLTALTAMVQNYQVKKATAEVDQEQGVLIFIRSKPVMEYEFLGKVNMPEVVWSGKPKEMVSTAVKRATKQFPKADAIIIQSENFGDVDAIKFK
jgi:hypothetical protein